ncbi:hypothetical protein ES288_A05G336000v1 [Gossypium darwinii]|uniref:Uncharacterized protein n=1 Tax=Gossypium darwinii TaxID=34276 RepID=A0A5D2GP91_GOSDA|nr:hypothetical protein ES288_A05G336000v1 [Gossypium darwinii]
MGGLRESWCFCKGISKTERMKGTIFSSKAPAMARITGPAADGISVTGFPIHRNLLLTTHVNLPSVAAAESFEIRFQNGVAATLVPQVCLTLECFLYSNWDTESDQEFEGYQTGNSEPLGSGHIGITLDDTIKACERFQRLGVEFSKKQLCISHGDYLRLEHANIF